MNPDPDNQLTLDDKVIERLRQDMGDDAGMVIESYVESDFAANACSGISPMPTTNEPFYIIGHRGAAGEKLENSLEKITPV
jgi:glycerophosphoryl diester phosphodiesterase